jgi:hypothetical protein
MLRGFEDGRALESTDLAAVLDELLSELGREVVRQDSLHPSGYPATRDGMRLGIASGKDELREARKAWSRGRCKCPTPMCDHHDWSAVDEELMQAAAVMLRTVRSIRLRGARAENRPWRRDGASEVTA